MYHGYEHRYHGYYRREQIWQTLRDHLPQRISVVSVVAHYIPVSPGIEVSYGKSLHLGKHLISDILQSTLCDNRHSPGVEERSQDTGKKYYRNSQYGLQQAAKIRRGLQQKRSYIVIYECLQEQGRGHAGPCAYQYADHYYR